jgi:hypothetical protein
MLGAALMCGFAAGKSKCGADRPLRGRPGVTGCGKAPFTPAHAADSPLRRFDHAQVQFAQLPGFGG